MSVFFDEQDEANLIRAKKDRDTARAEADRYRADLERLRGLVLAHLAVMDKRREDYLATTHGGVEIVIPPAEAALRQAVAPEPPRPVVLDPEAD